MCELPHITKTTKLQYLNWHLESEHEVDIYDCSLCEYTTQIESNFITHTKTEHFESQEKSDNIIDIKDKPGNEPIIIDKCYWLQVNLTSL